MPAPNLPSIFRNIRTKPRGFNYVPRYYDAKKEDLDKRIRIIKKEVELENQDLEIAKVRMQTKMRHKFESRGYYKDHGRTARLGVILALLFALAKAVMNYMNL